LVIEVGAPSLAGAAGAWHSLRLLHSEGRTFPAKLARRRGEIAMLWLRMMLLFENRTPAVIVRESGRSSIPEQLW
jgi:hypothetical protein